MDARAQFLARMDREMDLFGGIEGTTSGGADEALDIDFTVTESGRTVSHTVNRKISDAGDFDDMDFSVTSGGRMDLGTPLEDTYMKILNLDCSFLKNGEKLVQCTPGNIAFSPKSQQSSQYSSQYNNSQAQQQEDQQATQQSQSESAPSQIQLPNMQQQPQQQQQKQQRSPHVGPVVVSAPSSVLQPRHEAPSPTEMSFLSGILNPAAETSTMAQHQSQPTSSPTLTPVTAPSSQNGTTAIRKRPRSNSISGRLQYAAELEAKGLIDRTQKARLKDLIIAGDEDLQYALDQYDAGDQSMLEVMIQSGILSDAAPDLELLNDLDLNFLTVNDHNMGEVDDDIHIKVESDDTMRGSADHSYGVNGPSTTLTPSGALPIPAAPVSPSSVSNTNDLGASTTVVHPGQPQQQPAPISSCSIGLQAPPMFPTREQLEEMMTNTNSVTYNEHEADDGIGDLEFNGEDFTTTTDYLPGPDPSPAHITATASVTSTAANGAEVETYSQAYPAPSSPSPEPMSEYEQRMRSNSLFSALLSDPNAANDGHANIEYGRWMERDASDSLDMDQTNMPQQQQQQQQQSHKSTKNNKTTTTANRRSSAPTSKPGRKRNSLKSKSDSKLAKTLNELAQEEKRREKQRKKEQKEKEKREKKERKMQLKKLQSQEKAAAAAAAKAAGAAKKQQDKDNNKHSGHGNSKNNDDEMEEHIPGSGKPRSMGDPNLVTSLDENGLLQVERPDGWIGAYSPESRKVRIERFLEKRNHRVWKKTVKYDVRKNFADSRLRVKGRFVKKEDEMLMRDLMSLT